MENDKYKTQKKYLGTQKQLRVWVAPEAYEAFKAKCAENGESIYAVINRFVRQYTEKKSEE